MRARALARQGGEHRIPTQMVMDDLLTALTLIENDEAISDLPAPHSATIRPLARPARRFCMSGVVRVLARAYATGMCVRESRRIAVDIRAHSYFGEYILLLLLAKVNALNT